MAETGIVPLERIQESIYLIRGHKVMLSTDLASLYSVEPKVLIQSIKRNIDRFPDDFMFQLSADEFKNLKSQIVTSSWGRSASGDSLCLYGTGGSHAFQRASQPESDTGKY